MQTKVSHQNEVPKANVNTSLTAKTTINPLELRNNTQNPLQPIKYDNPFQRKEYTQNPFALKPHLQNPLQREEAKEGSAVQMKQEVAVNDDKDLESEADLMGAKALSQITNPPTQAHRETTHGTGSHSEPVQMKSIPDVLALKAGIKTALDAGDPSQTISKNRKNVERLTNVYLPDVHPPEKRTHDPKSQNIRLKLLAGDPWREGWFDRVDQRIQAGSKRTIGDALFWADNIKDDHNYDFVTVDSVELLGDELHDEGLGAAKVWFLVEVIQSLPFYISAVIKPEDRSIEKAILGSGDSIATHMNQKVGYGRRIKTLNMDTDSNHGTIIEFVRSGIVDTVESVLRKLKIMESESTVSVETIGFALMSGLHDLHDKNVIKTGGAPALIDADVAAQQNELLTGPDSQAGFKPEETEQVKKQMKGDAPGASQILEYAIKNPDEIIGIVKRYIANYRGRIVPVFTGDLVNLLHNFVLAKGDLKEDGLDKGINWLVTGIPAGLRGSQGLKKELGDDSNGSWDFEFVKSAVLKDFDKGVVPHFQYQPSTGEVFFHDRCIWKGRTLAQAMEGFKSRLEMAAQAADKKIQ